MKMKKQQQNPWVTALIIVGAVTAAAGIIFGLVKAIQAIVTEARYRALERVLREENYDADAEVVSEEDAEFEEA